MPAPIFNNGVVQLYQANASDLPVATDSVDCVVTSPPYWGLRDYGTEGQLGLEPTPEDYCASMVAVFREIWRVLKPSGTVWLNLGDSFADKQLTGMPWRVAFALQTDGWYLRSDIIWSKPNPMPESVRDRPTKAHEYIFLLTKSPRYYYDADAVREPHTHESSLRYARNSSYPDKSFNPYAMKNGPKGHGTGRNRRTVWHIATQPYPGAHFATFPEKLVEPCILAGSPVGGVILDPFVGSGTTMAVAQQLGRLAIGVDLSRAYLELATKRLGAVPYPMQHNNYSDIEEESDSVVEDDAPVPWMDGMFNEDPIASDPVLPDQGETAGEEFDRLTKPNRESLEKMKKELFG